MKKISTINKNIDLILSTPRIVTHSLLVLQSCVYKFAKKMNINNKIGERIKELRSSKKLSQEELSYKSSTDRSYIAGVESGKRNVTVRVLEKIVCEGLETSIRDFFNSEEFGK